MCEKDLSFQEESVMISFRLLEMSKNTSKLQKHSIKKRSAL